MQIPQIITFTIDNPYKIVSTESYNTESYNYTTSNHAKYAGKASVNFDSNMNKVATLLSTDFNQIFNETNSYSSSDTYYYGVNGRVISDQSGLFDFDGSFKITTESNGEVEGEALIYDGTYSVSIYNDNYYNNNTYTSDTKLILKSDIQAEDNSTTSSTLKSQKVLAAVNDLESFDITQESLSDKLTSIKNDMGTENKDEVVLKALTELALVYDNSIVSTLIESNSTKTSYVDQIMDYINDPVNIAVNLSTAPSVSNALSIINNSADKIKTACDDLALSFSDTTYVMTYSTDQNITYNDSLALRSSALSTASFLKLIAAYSFGSDTLYEEKTYTDGITTYRLFDIDEKSVFNDTSFFKLSDTAKLTEAKALLKESLEIAATIDPSKFNDPDDVSDQTKVKTDAQNILDAINSTSGIYTDGNTSVNINNLFNASYAIDRDDFGSSIQYDCDYDLNISIMYNYTACTDYYKANMYYETNTSTTASTLDDVILKIESNGVVYDTPQTIIDQFANQL